MQGIHETLNAMRDAIWWSETRARTRIDRPAALRPGATIQNPVVLTEDKGKSWLKQMAIAVPNGHVCNAAEAAGVAKDIGYPVALKMMSPSLPHKTEAGAVALGIKDAEALSSAIHVVTASVAAYDRAAVTDRFLIEAMSPKPLAELIVTLRADPHFGPSLVIGSGGVLTELVRDARTVLLPASKDEIERALCSLRVARLLEGYRGSQKADIPRISDALHRVCAAFLEARSQVAEVEINPMFVYPDHIVAVDALIQVPRS